jgi:hypothetical protein
MALQNEAKVGDVRIQGGIKTTVTDVDPESGAITWDVEYAADYLQLYQLVQQLFQAVDKASKQSTAEQFIKDWGKDVRQLRNSLRTYLRNNKAEEYAKVKNVKENSVNGGDASFTPGTGANYATPFAFNRDKKAKGSASKYYYKLGMKPVNETNPGASLGPGPKAGDKGVTDNVYVKNFGYKLVDPVKLAKQSKAIETKYLWGKP